MVFLLVLCGASGIDGSASRLSLWKRFHHYRIKGEINERTAYSACVHPGARRKSTPVSYTHLSLTDFLSACVFIQFDSTSYFVEICGKD